MVMHGTSILRLINSLTSKGIEADELQKYIRLGLHDTIFLLGISLYLYQSLVFTNCGWRIDCELFPDKACHNIHSKSANSSHD